MANLTAKQAKFVASYQLTHNSTEAAKNAGYSLKTAEVQGCQLLKNPKIINELEQWKLKKASEITKEDYIDKAMNCFEELDITEPNKPRFLEIAGKTLGYVGNNEQKQGNQTLNLTQININGKESQKDLWEMTRKLLGND